MLLFRPIRLYLVVLLLGIAVPEWSLASFGLRQNSGDAIAPSVCWNYRSDTAILSVGADRAMVFLAKEGSLLEAISAADGERIWMAEFGGELVSNVAVGGNQVFNRFDIPQLRGINKTGPYFHDHRAKTLEEVVRHYQKFFFFINVVRGFPLPQIPDDDIAPIVAYMKKAL